MLAHIICEIHFKRIKETLNYTFYGEAVVYNTVGNVKEYLINMKSMRMKTINRQSKAKGEF